MVSVFLWPQCGQVSVAVRTVMLDSTCFAGGGANCASLARSTAHGCTARVRVALPSLSRGHVPPQVPSQFGRHGLPVPPNPGYEIGRRRGVAVMTGAPRNELEHRGEGIEALLGQPVRSAAPPPAPPNQAPCPQLPGARRQKLPSGAL